MADPQDDEDEQQNLTAAAQSYATYRERKGNDVTLYELGSKGADGRAGAFADIATAIDAAEKFIFICDWSFQPYVRLGERAAGASIGQTVGARLNARAKAGVLVAVHAWDHTGAGAPDDQNDDAAARFDDIAKALGDRGRSSNLLWRKSSRNGWNISFSIHQKFVVLDAPGPGGRRVVKAFFGGLDLTKGRFDWGEHPILYPGATVEPLAPKLVDSSKRTYDDWYSAEFSTKQTDWWDQHNPLGSSEPGDVSMPRQPWQDYYGQITGPTAWDVLREFVGRWNVISITAMPHGAYGNADRQRVEDLFKSLFDKSKFVQDWESAGGPFVARVVRSITSAEWGQRRELKILSLHPGLGDPIPCNTPAQQDGTTQTEFLWRVQGNYENSIQTAYVNAIAKAKKFIYIESQYFIGSGSSWANARSSVANRIPKAIVDKICDKIKHGDDFHAYVVIPMFPEGDPVSGAAPDQRQFEWRTMQYMAQAVFAKADPQGKAWQDYLSFYFLANWTDLGGQVALQNIDRQPRVQKNKRYMVYVHSKLMIIDDRYLILGSANLNERSLAGNRDTEICIYLRPDVGQSEACRAKIQELRKKAWSDHFGSTQPDWDSPEKKSCSSALQAKGRANWVKLANGARTALDGHLVLFPFFADKSAFYIPNVNSGVQGYQDTFIFDAPVDSNGTISVDWEWASPTGSVAPSSWAE